VTLCYQITPAAEDTIWPRVDVTEHKLAQFWTQQQQARMVCHVQPATFTQRLETLTIPNDWRRPYVIEQQALYRDMERTTYEVVSYVALWGADHHVATLDRTIAESLSVPTATRVPYPSIVQGHYHEHARYLAPLDPAMPHLAVLTAYDVQGNWAPVNDGIVGNWRDLLLLDMPIALAIDTRAVALHTAQNWLNWVSGWKLSQGTAESLAVLQGAMQTEALHLVRYAILMQARRPGAFADMEQEIARVLGRRLQLARVAGLQAQHVRFFQDVAPAAIKTPVPARNTTAHGVGCKTPTTIQRSVAQHGVLLGTDMEQHTPLHYQLFGEDERRNGNAIVLGTSGSGKTTYLLTTALRLAVQGAQVVMMEPAHRARLLGDAIGVGTACAYHDVGDMPAINILDPVSSKPLDQRESIQRRLEIALGKPREGLGGRLRVDPHELTHEETEALDSAMQHDQVYGASCRKLSQMTPATAPLLSDLVAALHALGTAGAGMLARKIRSVLLGVAASTFDTHTSLQFNAGADVSLYSFQGVAQLRLPLVYDALFSMLNSYV